MKIHKTHITFKVIMLKSFKETKNMYLNVLLIVLGINIHSNIFKCSWMLQNIDSSDGI